MADKTNISLIHPHEATEEVQRLYDRIKSLMGRIAPTWRALAHKPEYLKIVIDKFSLLLSKSKIDMRSKLLVYLTVSIMNNCQTCIYAFTDRLKALGLTDEEFVELYSVIDAASGNNALVNAVGITPEHLMEIMQEVEE
jgi:AhpD family alkylhydroperoxidase